MSVKRKFTIDEVINLTENCYSVGFANWLRAQLEDYVTADDVRDLCDLREIGFKNVRWTGGCWIAEKDENDVNGDKHGGMLVCLSTRVGRMLYEVCKKENKNENDRIRNKVEDLMYDLYDGLNNLNKKKKKSVERIILVLEDLADVFRQIRDKQIDEKEIAGTF